MPCLSRLLGAVWAAYIFACANAQTFSSCNPLTSGGCPPNPALGGTTTVDYTKGPPSQFVAQGNPTYDLNGASFTIGKSGDVPQIASNFYIMFGKLEVTMKAAKGRGIVSSVVMQSDVLDEIDWEWLGANPNEVQTNYFGKGQTTTYNRGAFHPDPGHQDTFRTYTIDWTADQIIWSIEGQTIRVLRQQDAAPGQYPQTPMQIKIGSWSGGDPANAPGTIEWSQGPTDYSQGPFTMQVRSATITDYSTGTQYTYGGQDGTWTSIVAVGGQVNPLGSGNPGSRVVAVEAPAVTSMSPSVPAPFGANYGNGGAGSVVPWAASPVTFQTTRSVPTTYPGLPSGWTVTDTGRVLPPSSAPDTEPDLSSSSSSPDSPGPAVAAGGVEVRTAFDDRGFPTPVTVIPGASPAPRRFDEQGFLINDASANLATDPAARAAEGSELKKQGDQANGATPRRSVENFPITMGLLAVLWGGTLIM